MHAVLRHIPLGSLYINRNFSNVSRTRYTLCRVCEIFEEFRLHGLYMHVVLRYIHLGCLYIHAVLGHIKEHFTHIETSLTLS